MLITLKRYSYAATETEGVMELPTGERLATIEPPWIPNPNGAKGGQPFESCIPDGMYTINPWARPDGSLVWIIVNPALGVYRQPSDLPAPGEGRYLCLIHAGNWSTDVVGCVAPGIARLPMRNPKLNKIAQAVTSSKAAMRLINEKVSRRGPHILSIESVTGARDA